MTYTSIKASLFAAASSDVNLQSLLGSGPFRWYDQQLPQGAAFPCVVVQVVSNPRDYVTTGPLPSSWVRVQFTVYGTGNDSQNADTIVEALADFLQTFNGDGVLNRVASPNFIVADRDFGIAKTQPLTYMRVVDVRIYSNPNS